MIILDCIIIILELINVDSDDDDDINIREDEVNIITINNVNEWFMITAIHYHDGNHSFVLVCNILEMLLIIPRLCVAGRRDAVVVVLVC